MIPSEADIDALAAFVEESLRHLLATKGVRWHRKLPEHAWVLRPVPSAEWFAERAPPVGLGERAHRWILRERTVLGASGWNYGVGLSVDHFMVFVTHTTRSARQVAFADDFDPSELASLIPLWGVALPNLPGLPAPTPFARRDLARLVGAVLDAHPPSFELTP